MMDNAKMILMVVLWCFLTAILVSGHLNKKWEKRLEFERSVEFVGDYSNVKGDGITDDTEGIQFTITVAGVKGRGGILFDKRTYRVGSPFIIVGEGATDGKWER